jgi:hypothetical protein
VVASPPLADGQTEQFRQLLGWDLANLETEWPEVTAAGGSPRLLLNPVEYPRQEHHGRHRRTNQHRRCSTVPPREIDVTFGV